jgi:hypothetical protein
MPIPIDVITRKKLILVKQLYQHAVIQSESQHSYVGRIMALIGFDLAAETILKAVVAALEPMKTPADGFHSLIQQADKLLVDTGYSPVPDKSNIQHVHALRNDAQHKAKYPNEPDMSDCRTYIRDFLRRIIFNVWGLSFEALSLADAVQHQEVKGYLAIAESELKSGNYKESVVQAEIGFRTALELVERAFVGGLSLGTSAFVTINNYDEEAIDRDSFRAFQRMRKQFLISILGLNISSYWHYDQIALSVVKYSTTVADGQTEMTITEENVGAKDAEFAVSYAVNSVLQIENVVGELDIPFGITW